MSRQDWSKALQSDIEKLFDCEPNERNVIYANASIGILDYINDTEQQKDCVSCSLIDEKKQESLDYFIDYMDEKSKFQTSKIQLHSEYAYKYLKQMLQVDSEIAVMLYNSGSKEERQLIRQSYENILTKLK